MSENHDHKTASREDTTHGRVQPNERSGGFDSRRHVVATSWLQEPQEKSTGGASDFGSLFHLTCDLFAPLVRDSRWPS